MSTEQWSIAVGAGQFFLALLIWLGVDAKLMRGKLQAVAPRSKLVLLLILGGFFFAGLGFRRTLAMHPAAPRALVHTWGSEPPNKIYAEVDTAQLTDRAKAERLLLVCRIADYAVDPLSDAKIEKSAPFQIPGGPLRIELEASRGFVNRLVPGATVDVYLVLMPKDVLPQEAATLSDLETAGARILESGGFEVPPRPPSAVGSRTPSSTGGPEQMPLTRFSFPAALRKLPSPRTAP